MAEDDVTQGPAPRRRLLFALVAAGVALLLALGWAGVVTVTRLLDSSVEVALPDRPERPVTPTAFNGPSLCNKYTGPTPWMLRASDDGLTVTYDDADLDGGVRWGETTTDMASAIRWNVPSVVLTNDSADPVVTRGSAGFILIQDGVIIATPDAEEGARQSIVVNPGESDARGGGITPCLPELPVGSYLVYGVVPVTPLADELGNLPPSTAAELVVGEAIQLTISAGDDGVTLVTTVSRYDPDNPEPGTPDGVPPAVLDPATRWALPAPADGAQECSGEECG